MEMTGELRFGSDHLAARRVEADDSNDYDRHEHGGDEAEPAVGTGDVINNTGDDIPDFRTVYSLHNRDIPLSSVHPAY